MDKKIPSKSVSELVQDVVQPALAEALKGMLTSVTGDLALYTTRMSETAGFYAVAVASGKDADAERWKRQLKAQAMSLASITTDREVGRWSTVLWSILQVVMQSLVIAAGAAL